VFTTTEFPTAVKVTPPLEVVKVMSGVGERLLATAVKVMGLPEATVVEGLAVTLTEGDAPTVTV
jgi:hypothetical protein